MKNIRFTLDKIPITTDGSNPVISGEKYYSPIVLTQDTVISAYTVQNGCISDVKVYDYSISPSQPFYISNTPTNQNGDIISRENIKQLSNVNITVDKFGGNEEKGTFLVGKSYA